MESKNTFIKLNRKILDWEWYKDANTFKLFIHLLLTANVKDKKWQGIIVKRGELITSIPNLSKSTGLSAQEVRTAIKHLILTGEITDSSSPRFRIISIKNYGKYQDVNRQTNRQLTDCQQTPNRQLTATKESKECKEGIKNVVEVVDADASDDNDDRLQVYKRHVLLSENQIEDLLCKMGLEAFDTYLEKLDNFIHDKNANVKSCYETMLKWYDQDRTMKGKRGKYGP